MWQHPQQTFMTFGRICWWPQDWQLRTCKGRILDSMLTWYFIRYPRFRLVFLIVTSRGCSRLFDGDMLGYSMVKVMCWDNLPETCRETCLGWQTVILISSVGLLDGVMFVIFLVGALGLLLGDTTMWWASLSDQDVLVLWSWWG
jgi:hypothetical protein